MRWPAFAAFVTALAGAAGGAAAQQPARDAFTLYGGGRSGGSFIDSVTGASLRTEASGAFAASYDRLLDGSRQTQLFVSHQSSRLALGGSATPSATGPQSMPIRITHLHLGGTNFFGAPVGQGTYLSGGLGMTVFGPGLTGLSTEVRPSISLGFGWQVPLAAGVSLKLEARGYAALVNSEGGLFCSGGCVITVRGDTYTQGEVLLGLSFGF
jgi:hypothetical protein